MKRYSKIINGVEVVKFANEIVIKAHGMQTFNPSEDMILADGWEEYIEPTYTPTLEDLRARKIAEILAYDSSSEVNEFSINGQPMWLPFETRTRLDRRFKVEIAEAAAKGQTAENTNTTLWYEGQSFEMPLDVAQKILTSLELYATYCYDNTQRHIAEVMKMDSVEAIETYGYTTGYPDKLEF